MPLIWLYTIGSVVAVSLISLLGVLTLTVRADTLKKALLVLVSFSAGALFGDVFIHLLPELAEEAGFELPTALMALLGIVTLFVVEKIIHWRHCHLPDDSEHIHPFAVMNLLGESVHNFIDGLIIGASYLVSIPVGLATTLAVILHEIPSEIGDFGVLLHGGFSKTKALIANFITALTAVLGAVVALLLNNTVANLETFLIPFAAGGFLYIAGADLIPELHKEVELPKSILQFLALLSGMGVMFLLLFLE